MRREQTLEVLDRRHARGPGAFLDGGSRWGARTARNRVVPASRPWSITLLHWGTGICRQTDGEQQERPNLRAWWWASRKCGVCTVRTSWIQEHVQIRFYDGFGVGGHGPTEVSHVVSLWQCSSWFLGVCAPFK